MMTVSTTMTSQKKNKWRLKNEAKLKKYDAQPNNRQNKNTSGKSQDGGKVVRILSVGMMTKTLRYSVSSVKMQTILSLYLWSSEMLYKQ